MRLPLVRNRYRVIIVAITFACLTSICSNYNVINFTFICMQNDHSHTRIVNNETIIGYKYTPFEKSCIIWAVAVGTFISTMPFNYLYTKYGARYPFLVAGILSNVATFFIPLAADSGIFLLVILRFLQGVAYGADFSAIGLVCVRWAPLSETAIFIGLLTSFSPIATSFTNGISGVLCESSLGWRSAFHLHAFLGLVQFFWWWILYTDDPRTTQRVSEKELTLIQRNKSRLHNEGVKTVPYKALLTNPAILVVWFCAFVELSGFILVSTYAPIYFHNVLGYAVRTTGTIVAIATFSQFPIKIVVAIISDKLTCVPELAKIHFFNTMSMGLVGIFFAAMGFATRSTAWIAVLGYACINWFSCMNCAGFYKCGTHVSRQYAHVVIGTIQWMKCVALFVAPAMVSIMVKDERDGEQWMHVFLIIGIFLIMANVASIPTFSDQPADFTLEEKGGNPLEVVEEISFKTMIPIESK